MPEAAPSTTKEPTLGVHNAQAEKPWATGHADRQTGYRGQRCASWAARSHLARVISGRTHSTSSLPSTHVTLWTDPRPPSHTQCFSFSPPPFSSPIPHCTSELPMSEMVAQAWNTGCQRALTTTGSQAP